MTLEQIIKNFKSFQLVPKGDTSNEFEEGCDLAVECINEAIETRIDLLRDLEISADNYAQVFDDFKNSLILVISETANEIGTNNDFGKGFDFKAKQFVDNLKHT